MASSARLVSTDCDHASVSLGDDSTTVFSGACVVYGIYVETTLSAHTCPIQDASTAVITLPASTAAGTSIDFENGIRFDTSLIVNPNDAAGGVIHIIYRRVTPNAFTVIDAAGTIAQPFKTPADANLVLHYNFKNDQSLDGRIGPTLGFTRATTATYFDISGVMQTAASGEARYDHDPSTGLPLGLLVEESRENICIRSEEFTASGWTTHAEGVTTANQAIAPDGKMTADSLGGAGGGTVSNVKNLRSLTGLSTTASHSVSCFFKAADGDWAALQILGMAAQTIHQYYDLTNGVVGTPAADVDRSGIIPIGNGWYRCWLTFTSDAADTTCDIQLWHVVGDGDSVFPAATTSKIYKWGAHVEEGVFPTSYIPTTTIAVTRNADVVNSTDVTWYNSSAGTLFCLNSQPIQTDEGNVAVELSDNSASDRIALACDTSERSEYFQAAVSATEADLTSTATPYTGSTEVRQAAAYALNDIELYTDGVRAGTGDQSAALAVGISDINVGSSGIEAQFWNGHIAEIRYYNVRKDNTFLTGLSDGTISA